MQLPESYNQSNLPAIADLPANKLQHKAIVLLPSPVPCLLSLNLTVFLLLLVSWYNKTAVPTEVSYQFNSATYLLLFFFFFEILFFIAVWLYDMFIESSVAGYYTANIRKNLRYGFYLFVVSEAMLFFSFFWAFFHSSLSPTVAVGAIWPPLGTPSVLATGLPIYGTYILILSGVSITWANKAILPAYPSGKPTYSRIDFAVALLMTILLGFYFLGIQVYEYRTLSFFFNDSVIGSCFYILTGFHGFHVFLGLLFLLLSFWLFFKRVMTTTNYLFLEASILYWHFVDIIWIILFFVVYCWGFVDVLTPQVVFWDTPDLFEMSLLIGGLGGLTGPHSFKALVALFLKGQLPRHSDGTLYNFRDYLELLYGDSFVREWELVYWVFRRDITYTLHLISTPLRELFYFQAPVTETFREIIAFHGYLLTLIIFLALFLLLLLKDILFHFRGYRQRQIYTEEPYYKPFHFGQVECAPGFKGWSLSNYRKRRLPVNYTVSQTLELWWTAIPGIVVFFLSIASLLLIYSWDLGLGISAEGRKQHLLNTLFIKAKAAQWFWTYDYTLMKLHFETVIDQIIPMEYDFSRVLKFESHLQSRARATTKYLLKATRSLVLPCNDIIKLAVTASDVIHSWTVPSFGVKIDALPGRANVQSFIALLTGTFYGQCSEICGIKHAFMPIDITLIDNQFFFFWYADASKPWYLVDRTFQPHMAALEACHLEVLEANIPEPEIVRNPGKICDRGCPGITTVLITGPAVYGAHIDLLNKVSTGDLSGDQARWSLYQYITDNEQYFREGGSKGVYLSREVYTAKVDAHLAMLNFIVEVDGVWFYLDHYDLLRILWLAEYGDEAFIQTACSQYTLNGAGLLGDNDSVASSQIKGSYAMFMLARIHHAAKLRRTPKFREPLERENFREVYKKQALVVKSWMKPLMFLHNYWYATPGNLGNIYALGFFLLFGIFVQLLTGTFLVANYVPTLEGAFNSVQWIRRDVLGGYYVQSTHAIGASLLFIGVYIHIFRGLFLGSFTKKAVWLTGIGIYFLLALIAFLGYCLPWGQMSLWGCKVITSFLTVIPYAGQVLVEWVWGGPAINDQTLRRFYMAHIAANIILIAFIGLHIMALHNWGSSNPANTPGGGYIDFFPYIPVKDLTFIHLYIFLIMFTVYYNPNFFSHPENFIPANPLVTPARIVPEWYFLIFYAILRSIPSKSGGLLAMVGAIIIWAVLPWIAGFFNTNGRYIPAYAIVFSLFFSFAVLLSWLGAQPLRDPYIFSAQITTWVYYGYFIAFIPVVTRLIFCSQVKAFFEANKKYSFKQVR